MSSYDLFARLYDLEHRDFRDDIELYREFAARCDGPVLELGCGTGRVSLALAQAGYEVTGIDLSRAMLDLARSYAADAGLSGQVRFWQEDVRSFVGEARFALAIYPLNGFLHLLTVEDQLAALCNVRQTLLSGGLLIVDLPNPHVALAPGLDGQLVLRRRFRSPEGHSISSYACTRTDLANQVQHLTLIYDSVDRKGILRRTEVEMDLRFVYRYELVALLHQAGFEVEVVYGTYDLEPYESDSSLMFFVVCAKG